MPTTDLKKTLTDTGYIAIGLGVMGFQQAQSRVRDARQQAENAGSCLRRLRRSSRGRSILRERRRRLSRPLQRARRSPRGRLSETERRRSACLLRARASR